ncbi:MAG: hypothetical protein MZU84_04070 [Sphingobacterium sp.]|nr:hypothetical protein [Sphingobacterium sp.]
MPPSHSASSVDDGGDGGKDGLHARPGPHHEGPDERQCTLLRVEVTGAVGQRLPRMPLSARPSVCTRFTLASMSRGAGS